MAKRLKEAGLPQDDSVWVWEPFIHRQNKYMLKCVMVDNQARSGHGFAAPTTGELGAMLPINYTSWRDEDGAWNCALDILAGPVFTAETEANARGEMKLHLLEIENE